MAGVCFNGGMLVFFFAGLGLIVGSFLNVCILRFGTGKTLGGRSACSSCNHTLRWFDLIPVFSWVFLSGRCRYCGSAISIQYPFVEFFTGVLFALLALSAPPPLSLAISLAIAALLVCITVYDMRHTIIPDAWVYAYSALGIVLVWVQGGIEALPLALLGGIIAAAPLFFLWLISRGAWMGLGDAKLAFGSGVILGPYLGFMSTLYAFILGALIGVTLIALSSARTQNLLRVTPIAAFLRGRAQFTMKSEVPFGPFLVTSFLVLWLSTLFNIALPLLLV